MKYNHDFKRCMTCVMPESPGHISFNAAGECNLCSQFHETEKNHTNFDILSKQVKLDILQKKVDYYKKGGKYDCAVGVSGGKDSIMTLYITVKQLGLKPLAIFIDNGFALDEMYENVRNATDILGTDLVIFKTSDMIRLFTYLLQSHKNIYYCRVCHALLDDAVFSICQKNEIGLVLGGYTKGQQYIRNMELYWIYEESDRNIVELLSEMPEFAHLIPLYQNQQLYFKEHYGTIQQLSPFKYIDWNEDNILKTIIEKLKWKMPQNSWPDKSSNCSFNYVAQYLVEKQFGYAQHESELSSLIRSGEIDRQRALAIIESPICESDLISPLEKLGLSINNIL